MTANKQLTLMRILNAPRELVFKAWTDEKHMANWWGPRGCKNPICKMDVRPGGSILIHMEGPGYSHPVHGTFQEIIPSEKLVFTVSAFEDENGNDMVEHMNTVTFEEYEGKTKLTVHVTVLRYTPEFETAIDGMGEGLGQSLDKLAELIDGLAKG